jgi:hypothetical protein
MKKAPPERGQSGERQRAVPGALGILDQARLRADGMVEAHRRGRELLVAGLLAMGAALVMDYAQHVLAVLLVAGKAPRIAAISTEVA